MQGRKARRGQPQLSQQQHNSRSHKSQWPCDFAENSIEMSSRMVHREEWATEGHLSDEWQRKETVQSGWPGGKRGLKRTDH